MPCPVEHLFWKKIFANEPRMLRRYINRYRRSSDKHISWDFLPIQRIADVDLQSQYEVAQLYACDRINSLSKEDIRCLKHLKQLVDVIMFHKQRHADKHYCVLDNLQKMYREAGKSSTDGWLDIRKHIYDRLADMSRPRRPKRFVKPVENLLLFLLTVCEIFSLPYSIYGVSFSWIFFVLWQLKMRVFPPQPQPVYEVDGCLKLIVYCITAVNVSLFELLQFCISTAKNSRSLLNLCFV